RLFEHSPEPLTFLPIELQRRGGQMPRQDALDLLQGDDEHPERAKRKLLTLVRSQIIFENLADGMLYLNVRPWRLPPLRASLHAAAQMQFLPQDDLARALASPDQASVLSTSTPATGGAAARGHSPANVG